MTHMDNLTENDASRFNIGMSQISKSLKTLFIGGVVLTTCLSVQAQEKSQSETPLIPAALIGYNPDAGTHNYFFIVDKSARELSIWQPQGDSFQLVKKVPADIGKNNSDKKKQGDHATPEGIYFLQERKEAPNLEFSLYGSLAFTTDYPNIFDKADLKTGDGIWLHAIPDSVPLTRGSRGCVVLRNNTIKEVSQFIALKTTPIMIFDKVDSLSETERLDKKKRVTQFLDTWKASWATEDIDIYISFYDEQFKSSGMNKLAWRKHKERLANDREQIQIELSPASMFHNKNEWVIRMIQDYKSSKFADLGYKTLYVRESETGFKIIAEEFQLIKKNEAALIKTASQSEPNITN